jgi:hypothetical protein
MKKIFILVLFIAILSFPSASAQDGLVSYWSFDNSANPGQDDVGGNDGTVYGATWVSNGIKGGALIFDGYGDYVHVPTSSSLDTLNDDNELTISMWVKSSVDYPEYNSNRRDFWLLRYSSTDRIYAQLTNTSAFRAYNNIDGVGTYENFGTIKVDIEQWNHYVWIFNDTHVVAFINGSLIGTEALAANISRLDDGFYFRIGFGYADTTTWNGTIDEVRIYNRALSAQEVLDRYNEEKDIYSPADLDQDGDVDIYDLTTVTTHFGQTQSHQDWNVTSDVIQDGEIDIYDVVFITSRFSGASPPCTYTCRDNPCSSFDNCNLEEGECPSGQFCCSGMCSTPPPPCPTCRPSTCDSYENCTTGSGTCASGYCCSGTCTPPTNGTIIYASSCSRNDIQAAVDSAIIGDTLMIPACTENDFTGTVTVPAGIEIQGQGPTETILRRSSYENVPLFEFDGSNGEEIKFSGIKLQGTYTQDQTERGLNLINDPVNFRVWNCEFEDFPYYGVQVHGDPVSGVIWNCTFKDNARPGYGYGVLVRGDTSGDSQLGDNSWGRDDLLGTSDGVYIEDCTFSNSRHYVTGTYGGRFIIRYCTIEANTTVDASAHALDTHGSGPVSGSRGGRKFEVYENTITLYQPQYYPMFYKGGHGVIFNNTITNIVYQRDWCLFGHVCCGQNNCLTWPHRDMCTDIYVWGNSVNGESNNHPRESSQCNDEEDAPIHRQDRDWFEYEMPGYTPYPYPHPLRKSVTENVIYATGLSRDDIQAAVDSASIGDKVILPEGNYTSFSGTVNVPGGIEIMGQGPDKTIIKLGSEQIEWDERMFRFDGSNGEEIKCSGFKLMGTGNSSYEDRGLILEGDPKNFRVWNMEFEDLNAHSLAVSGYPSYGVIWNCSFKNSNLPGLGYGVHVSGWKLGVDTLPGDTSWSEPLDLGGPNAVFIEDCTFSECRHSIAAGHGARYVARYNTVHATGLVGNHAIDAHGWKPTSRGSRSWEIYENTVDTFSPQGYCMVLRAGDGVIFNNTITDLDCEDCFCVIIQTAAAIRYMTKCVTHIFGVTQSMVIPMTMPDLPGNVINALKYHL